MSRLRQTLTLQRARLSRARGKALKTFASKAGLVYFGTVHRHDEHDVIRGLTVSTTHKDLHYSVGSYDGYDIAFVDRLDTQKHGSRSIQHRWLIIQLKLRGTHTQPHLFFMPKGQPDSFSHLFAGLRGLQDMQTLVPESYHDEFTHRYTFYAPAHSSATIQDTVTPTLAHGFGARFWPHAVEVASDKVLVYIQEHRLDQTVLGSAVSSALWLAEQLDEPN